MPSKRTAIALAIALELTLDETDDLLQRAGFTLSHSQIFDVIIEYFIIKLNFQVMSEAVASFRKSSTISESWNDEIQKDYKKRGNTVDYN